MEVSGTDAGGRHRRRRGVYLTTLAAMIAAAVAARALAPGSAAGAITTTLAVLGSLPGLVVGVRWLWRKLTYRVGVRLFLSYLLIGLTPFALFFSLAMLAAYALIGQYGTVRVGEEVGRCEAHLAEVAHAAVEELAGGRPDAAQDILRRRLSPQADGALRVEWLLADGSRVWRSADGQALPVPAWAAPGPWRGAVTVAGRACRAVIERDGARISAIVLPLDVANSRTLSSGKWFDFRSLCPPSNPGGSHRLAITVGAGPGGKKPLGVWVNGQLAPVDEVEPGWIPEKLNADPFVSKARLLWLWEMKAPRSWESGLVDERSAIVTFIQVRPGGAIKDFFAPSQELAADVRTFLRVIGITFGSLYLIAVGFAVVMILRVTRSTARLTRGARAVARGDLDHRIRVKRRDQLGDLAVSFNSMTESVRNMLAQVAERGRLAREMELAREIQESLLPPSELSSGPLSVWAHFRPAAEVGGDYFDLFSLAPGRLMVAVGDVAGHGLHTGLLMAMVKSAVATLVEEGYRGRTLLERLNRLLLGQPIKQRMVSLALAEVDVSRGVVEIASAGHPPGMLLAADGDVEEILLSSLPLGHRWPEPPPSRSTAFAPGARLLLYSDGLVEARASGGQPFGYEALREVLRAHREAPAATLIEAVLAALDRHLDGQPPTDDLTLLLVEHRDTTRSAGSHP